MNIFFNSFAPKLMERIFYNINKNGINFGDISTIYSNVRCQHCYLGNVGITFIENIENVEEFIKEKNIKIVVTNLLYDYLLNNKDIFVVTLNKCDDENIYFYKDIPLLINKNKLSNECSNPDISEKPDINEEQNTNGNNIIQNINSVDICVSENKVKTNIMDSINILISNLSVSAMNKVIETMHTACGKNNIFSDKLTVFSNIKIDCSYFKIIFLENLNNNSNICNFINDKNINIFITNYLDYNIINAVKNTCYIVSLMPLKIEDNTKIYFYKELSLIFRECKNQLKYDIEKQNIQTNSLEISNVEKTTHNPKELYRDICLSYLNDFRKLKVPELKLNLNKEAVFIEYRILPHIKVLLRNMIYNLGDSWSYTIVCGNKNFTYMKEICDEISSNIKIINTKFDNLNQNEYNNMLCTIKFWDSFVGEKILIYQEDTCIFRKDIEQFLEFDYVGGAFALDSVSPINVGNGGFSLRTKSVMKKVIESVPPKEFVCKCGFSDHYKIMSKLELYPEDNYYPQVMQELKIGKVAPYDMCKKFSSEQVFTEDCLGMHCMWYSNKNWQKYIKKYFNGIFKHINNSITDSSKFVKYNEKIDVYFIHCKEFKDRNCKIEQAKKQLEYEYGDNYNINIFDGINTSTSDIDLDSQINILKKYDPNLEFDDPEKFIFYKAGQIGCYLGHHLIVKSIAESNNNTNYSIIFEDDIHLNNGFTQSVLEIIHYFESIEEILMSFI
jgi:hypothetical protein